jgi:hypothetical protein
MSTAGRRAGLRARRWVFGFLHVVVHRFGSHTGERVWIDRNVCLVEGLDRRGAPDGLRGEWGEEFPSSFFLVSFVFLCGAAGSSFLSVICFLK